MDYLVWKHWPRYTLIEYRMKAHAFGSSLSPAVATFCLWKCVKQTDGKYVAEFVTHNFLVNDSLISLISSEEPTDILERTQIAVRTEGNVHLLKYVSNDPVVMSALAVKICVRRWGHSTWKSKRFEAWQTARLFVYFNQHLWSYWVCRSNAASRKTFPQRYYKIVRLG